jgi:hypothetical protein
MTTLQTALKRTALEVQAYLRLNAQMFQAIVTPPIYATSWNSSTSSASAR